MKPDFNKNLGLVPTIIQNSLTNEVLMLGYMNEEAYKKSRQEKIVTFYSRQKKRLWTKGETSGNFLRIVEMFEDCDNDTILIKAIPAGPTCHTGASNCFNDSTSKGYLYKLEDTIAKRYYKGDEDSYTNYLFNKGLNKISQKVGEEAVELIIESKDENINAFKNEAADLLYHLLVLFKAKEVKLEEVEEVLIQRLQKS